MRLFDAVLILSLLAACGKTDPSQMPYALPSPGTTPTTQPAAPGAVCKSVYSIWQSTMDLERHDWTNVSKTTALRTDYTYTGYNGVSCPGPSQPLRLQVVPFNHPSAAEFPYAYQIQNNYPAPNGGCESWYVGTNGMGQPYPTYGFAHVKVECDRMIMCRSVYPAPSGCKEFR